MLDVRLGLKSPWAMNVEVTSTGYLSLNPIAVQCGICRRRDSTISLFVQFTLATAYSSSTYYTVAD